MAVVPRTVGTLTLRLIGEFAVLRAGHTLPAPSVGSRKARTVLKLLAVEQGRWTSADRIADVVWGAQPPQRPADGVATLVSRLRARLGDGVINGGRDGYRLGGPPAVDVDLTLAADDVAEARHRASSGETALAAASAQRALALLGDGRVLITEADAAWTEPARSTALALLREARSIGAAAALSVGQPATARDLAMAASRTDPYDEAACRLVMRAEVALGEPVRALAAFEHLRKLLAAELAVDPAPETRDLHVAILRERSVAIDEPSGARAPTERDGRDGHSDRWKPTGQPTKSSARSGRSPSAPREGRGNFTLAGRDDVVDALTARWNDAAGGTPALILITGEAGIGKTRLATEIGGVAQRTGGTVIHARCYETERSLFLQPIVDALGEHASTADPSAIRAAVGEWAAPVVALVPQIDAILDDIPASPVRGEVARQRAYDAFARYICRLASSPVLLVLDDLHQAGLATVELLHYLIRHAGKARLLIIATVRSEEGAATLTALAGIAHRIELGPLSTAAVRDIAGHAGRPELADIIATRTGGHPLFVVETLHALAGGGSGIPESLQAAVLSRVRRAGGRTEDLLRAAAVLGTAIEPDTLARLLDSSPIATTAECEVALTARLLVVADRAYEFANDLIREVIYASMPMPTRIAYHRRAADLLSDRPEAVGAHAAAAGDWSRASRAWLVAGELAGSRVAFADAEALLTSALDAASRTDDKEVAARAYLARGRARDALTAYPAALADLQLAADLARQTGDRRLEMVTLRELAGDVPVSLGWPVTEGAAHLQDGLRIAEMLGDRAIESDMLGRLAVIASNRLQFSEAIGYGNRAVRAARASGDAEALASALDGVKTPYAYLGEIDALVPILHELEPLLRQRGDLWRLQWAVYEGAFPALAAGRWDEALDRIADALDINRRSGYSAYEGWFVGHLGWVHRLRGDLDQARAYGYRAIDLTRDSTHAWWRSTACTQLAGTLLALGETDYAIAFLREGRAHASREGAEAYLLNCVGPLAAVTGDRRVLDLADALLSSIDAPEGCAWLLGAEAYLAVGRAWLRHGDPDRAATAIAPLHIAANRIGWTWVSEAVTALSVDAGLPTPA